MKNVIFDMDGVIFDSEHVCERCWEDYKEKYKLKDAKGHVSCLHWHDN